MRKSGVERSNSFAAISAIRSVLRAEMRTGLRDLAAEHTAEFLVSGTFARFEQSASGESAFEILFGQDATAAEPLFWALREKKIPGEAAGATMILTRELLAGKAGKAAVDAALKALRDVTENELWATSRSPQSPNDTLTRPGDASRAFRCRQHLAIAAVCRAAGRDADAEAAFKVAAESTSDTADIPGARTWAFGVSDAHRPYVEWGDFLHDRERYREAANRFLEGWKRFPDQPLLMFLSGKALVKAGDAKEGNRRVELAHWVALGQERVRGKFLDELVRRGEATAAKRETELLLRGCWFRDHYYGNALNQASQAAALNRDFATAEKCRQRSLLVILKTPNIYFVETSAYMTVPHDLLVHRARGRLAAGKVDDAVALAREALAVTPGHVDLVSGMVPELEKLGKKAEADELFATAWAAYQKVLTDFPDSPSARHSLATLAANCRRELDKGLTYATAAVKSDPASRPFREALAEVHFRKGEREKSLEVMTKLAEEDPRNRLYKRQLTRYRTGALDSPKPDRED
jgi:tetratricopeptide (TPR) repeat protein